jgi:hypothetical protein
MYEKYFLKNLKYKDGSIGSKSQCINHVQSIYLSIIPITLNLLNRMKYIRKNNFFLKYINNPFYIFFRKYFKINKFNNDEIIFFFILFT